MDVYNNLALYSINNTSNEEFYLWFTIIVGVLVFIGALIYFRYFSDIYKDDPFYTLIILESMVFGALGLMLGGIISIIWSMLVFYALPLALISFLIIKGEDIIKFISRKSKRSKFNNINIFNIMEDIKCEELAMQVYENMKDDFPDIRYERILENIKSKIKK